MPGLLRNATTADAYAEATTVRWPQTRQISFQVANAAVLYQLDESDDGKGHWSSPERFLLPTVGILGRNCSGFRLRSALAGASAQVSAELLSEGELNEHPDAIAPFSDRISATGAVIPGGGGMQLIGETILTAAQTVITLPATPIPATFAHLRILAALRGDSATSVVAVLAQINADGGVSYDTELSGFAGAVASAGEILDSTFLRLGRIPAGTAPANSFGGLTVDIPHYAGATNHKAVIGASASREVAASSGIVLEGSAGVWRSIAPITQIVIFPQAGSFVAGSRASLYGVIGA